LALRFWTASNALLHFPGHGCFLGMLAAGRGPVARGGGLLACGCRLDQRRHHRPVAGRVGDPFLQPRVATVEHALGGGTAVIVAIGPQLVEQRLGTLVGMLAGQFGELESVALALGVLTPGRDLDADIESLFLSAEVACLDEQAMEIRLLLDHRNDIVAERTRTVKPLRWPLLELCPELERSLQRGALNRPRVPDRVDRRLRKLPAGARVRIAREQVCAASPA
jgi:hypothetical protein